MADEKRCNLCGSLLDEWDEQQNLFIHKKLGYGSSYDGDEIRLQLCCNCFDGIVGLCAVSPIVEEAS